MKPILHDHRKGDTWDGCSLTIRNKVTGVPRDLTGVVEALCRVKNNPIGRPSLEFKLTDGTIAIPTPINGRIILTKRIIDIPANLYYLDLQLTYSNGDVKTVAEGTWKIFQDVS